MAKQLNVSLAFSADTSQAQKSIQNLQTSLAKISSMKIGDNLQLKEASDAAKMLSYHLNQAYNATTGNIDLSALNHSLQKSSTNVTQLSNKLLQAGANGQQAFVNLAQAISSAEYPMFKLGKRLTEFGNTLKNTIRWQFSSSLLHGMMGAYQQAIGYAEDLNTSLTNIRVVTGNSTEEMARFAEYANKAAKSLSTTTTAYTDAALIFYQQGLEDKDVQERTDITVKMANVTGESVTTVSDQLTAIWNNFNKEGDIAYEHYADVLTALGAATASSTDEIAGGLEKFAAIADTIGLSYEYAAAALATITSNTRQSEEVVGTALKTIFARLQGLKLGETLEDGTDLNKYSEALQKVGVDVLDATGELRRADDILTDMAAKWETLSNAEQVALAQAVGGVRQYNQIVALMDEWDSGDSDSMMANLETAYSADGALQEQADIWAESWEAAQKRVKAAAEGVYDSILDDKLFIGFNNVFADMLTGLEQVIDGVGGLKGVFIGVGSFIMSLMANKIQPALTNFVLNIKSMFSSAQAQAAALTGELQSKVSTELSKTGDNAYDTSQKQALSNANNLAEARTRLTLVSKNLTEQEKLLYQFDISLIEQDAQKAQSIADEITALERERDALYQSVDATQEKIAINQAYDQELKSLMETQSMWKSIMDESYDGGTEREQVESSDEYVAARQAVDEYIASKQTLNSIIEQTTQAIMDEYTGQEYAIDGFEQGVGVLQAFTNNLNALSNELGETNRQFSASEVDKYKRQLDLFGKTLDNLQGISADTKKELAQLFAQAKASRDTKTMRSNIGSIIEKIKDLKFTSQQLKDMGISLSPSQFKKFLSNLDEGKRKEKELIAIQDELNNKMNNFNPSHMIGGLERLTSAASAMGSVAMMGQSISSMINSWSNADLSFGEKLSTTFMSLSMLIPGAISAIKGLNTALQGTALQQALVSAAMKLTTRDSTIAAAKTILLTIAKNADMTADQKRIVTMGAVAAAMKAEGLSLDKNKRAYIARLVAQKAANGATKEEIAAFLVSKLGIDADTAAKIANKIATDSLKTSIMGLLGPIGAVIAIITALVAAFNAWNKAQEEKAARELENRKKASEAAIEEANKLEEERKKVEQLYTEYINLQNGLDGSVEAKEALKSKTEELCAALGVEWDALDKLQGKYDDVNRQMLEARRTTLLENINELQNNIDVAGEYVEDTVDKVQAEGFSEHDFGTSTGTRFGETKQDEWWNAAEWFDGNDTYQALETYKHNYLYGGGSGNVGIDNTEIRNLFYDWMYENYSDILEDDYITEDDLAWGSRGQRALYFNEGVKETEIVNAVKEFSDYLMANHEGLGVNTDAGAYDWFKQFNGDTGVEEQISAINGMNEELLASVKELAQVEAELAGMEITEIDNEEDFEAYKTQWMTNFRQTMSNMGIDISSITDDALNDIAEEFLGKYTNIGDVITKRDVSNTISEKTGIPVDKVKEIAAEYEDFLDLVPEINFDLIDSEEKLRIVLNTLQAEADANKIETKVETVVAAKGNLKEDMSYGDYIDFETSSGIKWGQFDEDLKQNIIDYTSFLQMSYEEQVSYLDSIQSAYHTAQAQALSTNLSNSQQLLNNYLTEYETLQEKINAAKQEKAAPILAQIEEFKNEQSQYAPDSEAYNTYAEGISNLMTQYEAIMNSDDASPFLSEEELARMYELQSLLDTTQDGIDSVGAQLNMVVSDILNSATSLDELQLKVSGLLQEDILVDYNIYGEALIELASKYDNCSQEAKELQEAMLSGDETMIQTKLDALELAVTIGELSKKYGLDAEDVETHAKLLRESAEGYELTAEQAANLAVANRRMNKGVKTLNENWKDWSKILKSSNRNTMDYADTLNDAHAALADLVGAVDAGSIPLDFLDASTESGAQHLEWMEKAAKGDSKAINQLGVALTAAQVEMMEFDATMAQMAIDGGFLDSAFDTTAFDNYKAEVMEGITALQTAITNGTVAAGDNIAGLMDGTGKSWVESLNAMAMATGMSVEQMNAMLNQLGVQTEVKVENVKQKMSVPTYIEVQEPIPVESQYQYFDGENTVTGTESRTMWKKYTIPGEPMEVMGNVQVAQIKAEGNTSVGSSPEITYTGTSGGSVGGGVAPSATSGGSGGGGGNKNKKTSDSRKKKSDIVDPYKEVNDQIERTNHLMSKNNTLAEGMWGAARSAKMRENIALQKQQVALLEEQLRISEQQMNLSRQDLNAAAGVLGIQLQYDADGLVTNIVDVEEQLWRDREALLDSFGGEMDEDEQAQLDAFDKYMENFTSAYDEYESHRQQQMQSEADILAAQLEAQQMMFDDLNQTLEENISLIEKDLELVEYYLSKVEDDFYGMAEAAALMVGNLSSASPGEGGQLGAYLDTLEAQKKYKEELDAAYANGDINQAQYIEGLMNCQSATIEALQSLNELDKTMKGYYGETLEAAQEELSKYTDMMDHHTEVLEHYSSLLELIGASKDWERMKTVLEAQVSVAENAAAVSKANYEMLAQEAADKKAAWEALGKGLGDELTYEESVIKQQWLDAQAAADEAQNQMLDDAAAWAESLKSLLETELAELADILNESLSGEFGSLDNMMTAMERANSLQEEYLTTTNQVYETNKLMRTAQQEIDKTTNSVAKRRLKQYIDETEQLQNKNKLSQFELDIQQAKYDLLVAEIALEEAQQAKSTVRLQRDSEGNFGYVYTADQNAIAEAEQQLEDAQNALYNIGLEGANKYAESYAQTIQEMNDAVTELTEKWQNGEISSKEEYQRQMLALEEYYGEKLMQYSELHSIAVQTDSKVAAEAWSRDFSYMTNQTQLWMQNVDKYVQGVEASMERYEQGIARVEEHAGLDLESLKEKTANIKTENKELVDSITNSTNGLLKAMKDEIAEVGNLTREYAALRTEIQGTVDDYEDLLKRMGVDIDTVAGGQPPLGGGDDDTGGGDDDTGGGDDDTGGDDTGTKTISVGGKVNAGSAQIYDYAGDTSGERQYFRSDPIYKVLKESGDWIQVRHHKLSAGVTGWFKKSDVAAMNTGGYTGDWAGSYGKLAFLHQKELVLNAQDTENLLASMDILDKIISTIDLYSSSAQLGGLLSSPHYRDFTNESLEQNVHIEASFPAVQDRNEIEEAFNTLINRASQYANKLQSN